MRRKLRKLRKLSGINMVTYYYVERTHQIWKQFENSTEELEGQTTNIQVNNKKYISLEQVLILNSWTKRHRALLQGISRNSNAASVCIIRLRKIRKRGREGEGGGIWYAIHLTQLPLQLHPVMIIIMHEKINKEKEISYTIEY